MLSLWYLYYLFPLPPSVLAFASRKLKLQQLEAPLEARARSAPHFRVLYMRTSIYRTLMRLNRRTVRTVVLLACFVAVFSGAAMYMFSSQGPFDKLKIAAKKDKQMQKLLHFEAYKSHLNQYIDNSIEGKDERCMDFFGKIDHYSFPLAVTYNKDIDKYLDYYKRKVKNKEPADKIEKEFNELVKGTYETDTKMLQTVELLRVFNRCFLEAPISGKMQKLYEKWISKLFPYINDSCPIFHAGNDTTWNNGIPIASELSRAMQADDPKNRIAETGSKNRIAARTEEVEPFVVKKSSHVIDHYFKNINGRGIVISAKSQHLKDATRLIRILRALNNHLPIQVVFRGSLNHLGKQKLVTAATESYQELLENLPSRESSSTVLDGCKKYGCEYPKQEITFVNTKPLMKDNKHFQGYNNKLIAVTFSSFSEIILLDADVVPLVNPEELFESPEYKSTGTFFFKDRSLRDTNDYLETNFVHRLLPYGNGIEKYFDLSTLNVKEVMAGQHNFLRGYRHYQEAGVVVLNKKENFLACLMLLPLGLWGEPLKSAFWGDKEHYWLSMLMSGRYPGFNQYEAASVGQVSERKMQYYDILDPDFHEVCSTHPGHVDKDGKLLWVNSGFNFCKKNSYYRDRNVYPFNNMTAEHTKQIYDLPLLITHAIVPPSLPDYRGIEPELGWENAWRKTWNLRLPDSDELNSEMAKKLEEEALKEANEEVEQEKKGQEKKGQEKKATKKRKRLSLPLKWYPQKGWVKNGICSGYYYCGYDKIQGYNEEFEYGRLFNFDKTTVEKYEWLGALWAVTPVRRSI